MDKKTPEEIAFNIEVFFTELTIILWFANAVCNAIAFFMLWLIKNPVLIDIATWICVATMITVVITAFASLKSRTNISTACCIAWFSASVVAINGIITFLISFMTNDPIYEFGIPCIIVFIAGIIALFTSATESTTEDIKKRKDKIQELIDEEENNVK